MIIVFFTTSGEKCTLEALQSSYAAADAKSVGHSGSQLKGKLGDQSSAGLVER